MSMPRPGYHAAALAARLLPALLLPALTACATGHPRPVAGRVIAIADWRQTATGEDRDRLRGWRSAWMAGFDAARKAGHGPAIDAEGALFDPDHAIQGAVPPPGPYRCRLFKFGASGTAMSDFTTYPATACRIDDSGAVSSIFKLHGQQRPSGVIFHDNTARAIFLGTMMMGDETRMIEYGRDAKRDMIGFVERVGPERWRLVLPSPQFESMIDVVELVPGTVDEEKP